MVISLVWGRARPDEREYTTTWAGFNSSWLHWRCFQRFTCSTHITLLYIHSRIILQPVYIPSFEYISIPSFMIVCECGPTKHGGPMGKSNGKRDPAAKGVLRLSSRAPRIFYSLSFIIIIILKFFKKKFFYLTYSFSLSAYSLAYCELCLLFAPRFMYSYVCTYMVYDKEENDDKKKN